MSTCTGNTGSSYPGVDGGVGVTFRVDSREGEGLECTEGETDVQEEGGTQIN